MMRGKLFLIAPCCLAAALIFTEAWAAVSATVDRQALVLDETLTLTISKEGGLFFSHLDLSGLEKDFRVVRQNRSSSTQIVNNNATAATTVRIELAPRHAGALQIPPLSVGSEKTQAITVQVTKDAEPKTGAADLPIFLETGVDGRSVYVQAQVLFTLKIYAGVGVEVLDPGVPQVQNAFIEALDTLSYEKSVAGKSYRVFELKYALFPQKSGMLEIPRMDVRATVASPQRYRDFFDPSGSEEKNISLRSESEIITVRESSPYYPERAVWLPAADVRVAEKWSQEPADLKVGEATTLTLEMTADGVRGSLLPPIRLGEMEGFKLYQGEAEVVSQNTDKGVVAVRRETIVLIPTRAGTFHQPELRIAWWNTGKEALEYAVINGKELLVKAGTENGAQAAMNVAPEIGWQPAAAVAAGRAVEQETPIRWILAIGVLGILWLATLLLLFRARRQLTAAAGERAQGKDEVQKVRERDAFTMVRAACGQNDPRAARNAVVLWNQAFWPEAKMITLADMRQRAHDKNLNSLLSEMDAILYSKEGGTGSWQGENLLNALEKIRNKRKKKRGGESHLPPLYQ